MNGLIFWTTLRLLYARSSRALEPVPGMDFGGSHPGRLSVFKPAVGTRSASSIHGRGDMEVALVCETDRQDAGSV